MPKGSPIDKKMLSQAKMVMPMLPAELKATFDTIVNSERYFTIPVRVENNGKEEYVIVIGLVLKKRINNVAPNFDAIDLSYLATTLRKASDRLGLRVKLYEDEGVPTQESKPPTPPQSGGGKDIDSKFDNVPMPTEEELNEQNDWDEDNVEEGAEEGTEGEEDEEKTQDGE